MIKSAYAYLRVSSEEQVTNYSLDNQYDYCKREAERQGYELITIYREEGASAKTTDRPELLRLLEDCRTNQKQISAVFIYKIDRISRDTYDFLAIKRKLAQYGIRIISVTEPVEDTPTGEFLETLLAASAKLDNATKSIRSLDGMLKRLEAGMANGKATVGYLNVTRDEKQVIDPDPEQFEKVKKAWEEMDTGIYTLESIIPVMQKLDIKIRYGSRLLPITKSQQTQRIFRDKFYAGYVVSKKFGIDKKGNHTAMIDEDLFYRVQAILDGRSRTAGLKYQRNNPDFPLRGHVICATCRKLMTGANTRKKRGDYPYYYCGNKDEVSKEKLHYSPLNRKKILS
jgi:DNA invertase Pin-like site-specific DNA recombinase